MNSLQAFFVSTYTYRRLIVELSWSNLFTRFRRSVLGILWSVVAPLTTVAIWYGMHRVGILAPGDTGIPYWIYLLTGVTIFNLFVSTYDAVSRCITDNSNLILDTTIPPSIYIVESLLSNSIRFMILFACVVLLIAINGYRYPLAALWLPLILAPLVFTAIGMGILFSLFRVVLLDITLAVDRLLPLVLYSLPVVYSSHSASPMLHRLACYNPLSYLVTMPRDVLLFGTLPSPTLFFTMLLFALCLLALAIHFFMRSHRLVVEKLLS